MFSTKFTDLASDLGREFSRRADHEGLQLASLHLNTLQDGQGEGSGLAASRLRMTNDIPAGQQGRNRFNLNGCWLSVTEVLDHGGQGGG